MGARRDGDGNGKLDYDEFKKHLSGPKGLGFEATEVELGELFQTLDNDQSGSLASKEVRGEARIGTDRERRAFYLL